MIKEDFLGFLKQTVGFFWGGDLGTWVKEAYIQEDICLGERGIIARSNGIFGIQPNCHTFLSLILEEKKKQLHKMTA